MCEIHSVERPGFPLKISNQILGFLSTLQGVLQHFLDISTKFCYIFKEILKLFQKKLRARKFFGIFEDIKGKNKKHCLKSNPQTCIQNYLSKFEQQQQQKDSSCKHQIIIYVKINLISSFLGKISLKYFSFCLLNIFFQPEQPSILSPFQIL